MNACGVQGRSRLGSQGSVMQAGAYLSSSEAFAFCQQDLGAVDIGLVPGLSTTAGQFPIWDFNGRCSPVVDAGNQQLPSPQPSVAGSPSGTKRLQFAPPMSSKHFPRRFSQPAPLDSDSQVVEQRHQV